MELDLIDGFVLLPMVHSRLRRRNVSFAHQWFVFRMMRKTFRRARFCRDVVTSCDYVLRSPGTIDEEGDR